MDKYIIIHYIQKKNKEREINICTDKYYFIQKEIKKEKKKTEKQ